MSVGWSWVDYTKTPVRENPANQLGREFGITVNDDLLADPTHHIGQDEAQPLFHKFDRNHPIFQNQDIDIIASSGNVSSLRISGSAEGSSARGVVWGDEDTYSAKYHDQTFEPGGRPIIAAVSEYGHGRVIYLGHVGFMTVDESGTGFYSYNNRQFVLNSIEWLARIR